MLFFGGDFIIIADKLSTSCNLLEMARQFVYDAQEKLPALGITLGRENTETIEFLNQAGTIATKRILALPAGRNVGRSHRARWLLATEMAAWQWGEQTWSAVTGAPVAGSFYIVESTPIGLGNKFAELWHNEENGFSHYQYDWKHNPTHGAEWERTRRGEISPAYFQQEHCCDFLQSGNPVFDAALLGSGEEPLRSESGFTVWAEPVPGREYCSGSDPSGGRAGSNWCVCYIMDRETGDQVAELRGRWKQDVFARKLDEAFRL